jgi:hypothetical protein
MSWLRGESGRAKIAQIPSPAQIPAEIRALAPKIREAQAQWLMIAERDRTLVYSWLAYLLWNPP